MSIDVFNCKVDLEGQAAVMDVLASGNIASGEHVGSLEAEVSAFMGGRDAIAVSNMTVALIVALKLAGVGVGDEVMTLAFNCLQSNAAISQVGARPVWVDIDPKTGSMDLEDVRASFTSKTKALMVYHVAGYPADVTSLKKFCNEKGIKLIEDANAALGARLTSGELVGTLGDFAVFSFYPTRMVNGADGAVLLCSDPELAERARRLRRFGVDTATFRDTWGEINPYSDIKEIGLSGAMSNVSAVLARISLRDANLRFADIRRNAAKLSNAIQRMTSVRSVEPLSGATPSYWVYMILAKDQNFVIDMLAKKGVGRTKLHQPNDTYSCFRDSARDLPGTREFSMSMIGLPVGWWMGADQIDEIIEALSAV